ncbi:MAG: filamentous hemagglutinin N-terminal domain-containing protein [Janthinobacterium lividum]
MNAIYRLIWSRVAHGWIAVAECHRRAGKGQRTAALCQSALLVAVTTAAVLAPAHAGPTDGVVSTGSAAISQSGSTTTITQSSRNVSLNWGSFNVGSGETVNFVQPSTTALAINRITGGSASQIMGSINANGQLYLINPSGMLFGQSAQVNVGGLVASALDVSGEGDGASRKFSGPGTGSIINHGTLRAASGGYIALLGNQVSNQGVAIAHLGSVTLAGGNAVTLVFSDNSLVNVQVDRSTFDTLVENRGLIVADGGMVLMSAGMRESLFDNAANNSGIIQARGVENRNGRIVLTSGGANGKTTAGGTLDVSSDNGSGGSIAVGGAAIAVTGALLNASGTTGAGSITVGGGFHGQEVAGSTTAESVVIDGASSLRARSGASGDGGQVAVWSRRMTRFEGSIDAQAAGASGNGGSAEVSSAGQLDYRGNTNLLSAHGRTGTLLLDPYDITISTSADSNSSGFTATAENSNLNTVVLANALNSANVTVSTGASGSQAGNITVADPFVWTGATTLTLNAAGAIAINAPITASAAAGGLLLSAGAGQAITASAAINVGSFTISQGNWLQNSASLPGFSAGTFSIGNAATFQRMAGGNGQLATPFLLTDIYGLQGLNSMPSLLSANFALAGNIDASTTSGWNGGAGFMPIGSSGAPFTGSLNGRNYALVNLTINRPALTTGVGLFGQLANASVSNLTLLNAAITGGSNGTAALAGTSSGTSTLSNITVTGSVTGNSSTLSDNTGGIVGALNDSAALTASAAAVIVTGYGANTGGAVGSAASASAWISQTSATGAVSGKNSVGGLVGLLSGSVTDSYASGAVTQTAGGSNIGGLVGTMSTSSASATRSYAAGLVTGTATAGSFAGRNDGTILASYWNSTVSSKAGTAAGSATGASALSTAAMHTQSSFAGWDFTGTWFMSSGLNPTLRAATTILGSAGGNQVVSTGADSTTVTNTSTLQNLLGAGNVLLATRNGTLNVNNALSWSSDKRLILAASGAMAVNASASLSATGGNGSLSLVSTAGSIAVTNAALSINGGSLSLLAPKSTGANAIALNGATINAASGVATLAGSATSAAGVTFTGVNALSATGSGVVNVSGTTATGRGILVNAGAALDTAGNVTLAGVAATGSGFSFCAALCSAAMTNSAGNLTVSGFSGRASGIDLFGSTLANASSGSLTISGRSITASGLNATATNLAVNDNGGGIVALYGSSSTSVGINLTNASVSSASGNLALTGQSSTSTAVYLSGTTINAGSGATTISGTSKTSYGGILVNSTLNAGSGSIDLQGSSSALNGINPSGAVNTSGTVSVTGTSEYGKGLDDNATWTNLSGNLSLKGISSNYIGVRTTTASYRNYGNLILTGVGPVLGLYFRGNNAFSNLGPGSYELMGLSSASTAPVELNGGIKFYQGTESFTGTINVTGVSAVPTGAFGSSGIDISGATINGAGGLGLTGTTSNPASAGIIFSSDSALNTSASMILSGSNSAAAGAGILIPASATLVTSGTLTMTDGVGSAASDAIRVAGVATVTSGSLTIAPASSNGIAITAGARVQSTGAGNLLLAARGAGSLRNDGTLAQTTGASGSLTLSTENGALINAGTISASATAKAVTLKTSGAADIVLAAGSVLSSSADGDAIILASGRNFLNAAGAAAIVLTPQDGHSSRWLIYSGSPASDVFGQLDSGNAAVWNTSYGAGMSSPSQRGNRYVFSYQPTAVLASTDSTKTYGTDVSGSLAGSYTVTGLQAGIGGAFLADTAASVIAGMPALASAGAVAGASVNGGPYLIDIAPGSVTALHGYAVRYQSTGLLHVDPAPLRITANDALKIRDGYAYHGGAGVNYQGFVNGEDNTALSGALTYGGSAQGARTAGSYVLSASGLSADNYTVINKAGRLTLLGDSVIPGGGNIASQYDNADKADNIAMAADLAGVVIADEPGKRPRVPALILTCSAQTASASGGTVAGGQCKALPY